MGIVAMKKKDNIPQNHFKNNNYILYLLNNIY